MTPNNDELSFLMGAIGFSEREDGTWKIDSPPGRDILYAQVGLHQESYPDPNRIAKISNQEPVLETVRRFRTLDDATAREISIAIGNITSFITDQDPYEVAKFVAKMVNIGRRRSGGAIASAIVPYIMSGGSLENRDYLKERVSIMSEAIEEEERLPMKTEEMGISQALRLRRFQQKFRTKMGDYLETPTPDILSYLEAFDGFPTTGAEFHIPTANGMPDNFLERLVIFNMAQYQRGSFIPFSRKEDDVIEVRMNPSIYPITIANWNLMRLLVPELTRQYFSLCIGKKDNDFTSHHGVPSEVLLLQTLGSIIYASLLTNAPPDPIHGELGFGDWYIGQIVKLQRGKYSLSGGRQNPIHVGTGQLNLYVVFGATILPQAYYLSMACAEPNLLKVVENYLGKETTPHQAVKIKEQDIKHILETLNASIMENPRLRQVQNTVKGLLKN